MGGASVALAEQATGLGANPAAPAVRGATANDRFEWDWSLDWLNPDLGDDFDNNGQNDGTGDSAVVTAGLAFELEKWGLGFGLTVAGRSFGEAEIGSTIGWALLARSFGATDDVSVGVGVRAGQFTIADREGARELVSVASVSPTAGVLWRPADIDLRVGLSGSLPVNASAPSCASCGELVIPERVRLPWDVAIGAAWRFGPTRWNRPIEGEFRDERALTVAADLLVIGALGDANGIQRWMNGELQPSGRDVAVSLRGGADLEAIPAWVRLRAGSYWEPGRLEGAGGRLHGTFGTEVRVLAFRLWSHPYRVRLSFTADLARHYGNWGFSIGFW